jgi:protein involved in polysaccharide export with SLBB domain
MERLDEHNHGLRGLAVFALSRVLAVVAALGIFAVDSIQAQQLPSGSQLQQLQQQLQGQGGTATQPLSPSEIILEPTGPLNRQLPPSRLEQILSNRAGVQLKQFGYEQLGVGRPVSIPQAGAVQESYILGSGDEIIVTLRGQENSEYRTSVNRDGTVTLPRLSPISAAGRSLGEFQRDLVNAIHRAYVATEGYVTIGRVRQVSVLVSGEVYSPGVRILNGLSTPVDAILVSSGVKKTGSLRNVYILRGSRRIPFDLYSVLTGHAADNRVSLADGDRIIVPPLGPTVAVAGWVRRPAIYELGGGRTSLSVRELMSLAGGLEVRGKYRMSVLRVASDGRNQMVPLENESGTLGDSDILFVQPAANQTTSMATLSGGTPLAGQYVAKNTKLSEILKSPGAFGANPYTLFGIISRRDPTTLMRTMIAFTPTAVLRGVDDLDLQSEDIVRVLSTQEASLLFTTIRKYEDRRNKVQDILLNPVDQQFTEMPPPSPANTGTQTNNNYDQNLRLASEQNRRSQQNLANESESDSLKYVEREMKKEKLRADYPFDRPYDMAGTGMQGSGTLPGQNGLRSSDPQTDFTDRPYGSNGANSQEGDAAGSQLPYVINPNTYNSYNSRATPQAPQQVGPYRESRPGETPTLGQNLQEQSLAVGQVPTNQEVTTTTQLAAQLQVDPVVLMDFMRDHVVNVGGAVRGTGLYLVGPDADIKSVLQAAGGLARWADRTNIEVISTEVDADRGVAKTQRRVVSLNQAAEASYIVAPRDEVRVSQVLTEAGIGAVELRGQIRNAGTYQIGRGEHLSQVLLRAGGLTTEAYPYGTVFLRRSAAARERDAFRREATEIENQLLLAMSRRDPNAKLSPEAFTALQSYVSQLRNQVPLGRVTISADPTVLAANPAEDPLLEPGDVIFVPQRPYSISVLGEVLQPGTIPYKQDSSMADYVARAGGYSQFADSSETILVLPDGSARRMESSWFHFGSDDVPPGSTIFVARDVSGIDLHQIIIDTTAIVSQLATTAASLAVLSAEVNRNP